LFVKTLLLLLKIAHNVGRMRPCRLVIFGRREDHVDCGRDDEEQEDGKERDEKHRVQTAPGKVAAEVHRDAFDGVFFGVACID
jgi:hypothetical protein